MKTVKRAFLMVASTIALAITLPLFSAGQLFAQDEGSPERSVRPNDQNQSRTDGDLIRRLNLSPDQMRQIRGIRQESAEELRLTGQRMRMAQHDLDEAVYADSVDEAVIDARARDLATAQAAVARFRARMELRIRRVLTPEQLSLLRDIREQARDRNRILPRGMRRNPNAFNERARPNIPRSDQNGIRPNSGATPQNQAPVRPVKP